MWIEYTEDPTIRDVDRIMIESGIKEMTGEEVAAEIASIVNRFKDDDDVRLETTTASLAREYQLSSRMLRTQATKAAMNLALSKWGTLNLFPS